MSRGESRVKAIVSFIGVDYNLLARSGEANINLFFFMGLIVLTIAVVSFVSVFYAFRMMFHRWYAELLLAGFFSLTFLNIYLLLIQTFSKEPLPPGYKTGFWTTSNLARVMFVLMISFLIAQPIRIFFLEKELDADVDHYRAELYSSFVARNTALYKKDLERLERRLSALSAMNNSGVAEGMKRGVRAEIAAIGQRTSDDNALAYQKIAASDFFIKRILLVGRYRNSWLICFGIMFFFSSPVVLIQFISGQGRYYAQKIRRDHDYIEMIYGLFKDRYAAVFAQSYGIRAFFSEPYEDPPYNWTRKREPDCGSLDDFRKEQGR